MTQPVLDRALKKFAECETNARRYLEHQLAVLRTNENIVREATENYLETRVAVASRDVFGALRSIYYHTPKPYFEELAGTYGRKLLYCEQSEDDSRIWHLTIPSSKRMTNIASPLLLVAQEGCPTRWGKCDHFLLYQGGDKAAWKFWFCGAEGKEMLDAYVERCRVDPVFRVIIGD